MPSLCEIFRSRHRASRLGCYSVLLVVALFFGGPAAAEDAVSFGPFSAKVPVAQLDLEVELSGRARIDSNDGMINADGWVDLAVPGARLEAVMAAAAARLLPQTYTMRSCNVSIQRASDISAVAIAHELRLGATLLLRPENCSVPSLSVSIEVPVIPVRADNRTIRFSVPRDPTITLPWQWRIPARIFVGDLQKRVRSTIQGHLDSNPLARVTIPEIDGVSMAFQGTNVTGRGDRVIFHVVGDFHATAGALVKLAQGPLGQWKPLLSIAVP